MDGGCFAAGTPLITPSGSQSIETFKVGDVVLSRRDNDPDGDVQPQIVEEIFHRLAKVWEVHVGQQAIQTTEEHPFWVIGQGWVMARELGVGDRLLTLAGEALPVTEIIAKDEWATVFNIRVADWHTYFVGSDEWGFSLWAHNAECNIQQVIAAVKYVIGKGKHFENLPESAKKVADALSKGTAEGRETAIKELDRLQGVGPTKAEQIVQAIELRMAKNDQISAGYRPDIWEPPNCALVTKYMEVCRVHLRFTRLVSLSRQVV